MQSLPLQRQRPHIKKPTWIITLVSLVCVFLVIAYCLPPQNSTACYIFSSSSCKTISSWLPPPARELTDEEIASRVVIKNIMNSPSIKTDNPKIAFMFLSPGSLAFERLAMKVDFQSIFMHQKLNQFILAVTSKIGKFAVIRVYPLWVKWVKSRNLANRVDWGKISMVDAEKRLLANALKDPDNQHFVLLSDSCVPLRDFDYVYNYLMYTNVSFIDSFEDPGPHGNGRYSDHMLPEVEKKFFRKGAQWFTMKRQHAIIVMADSLYYRKFKEYCRPGMDGRNCYADEHYLPTFFTMFDPKGIANWSVTHVDWSEHKWHPKSYGLKDISSQLIKNLSSISESVHETSNKKMFDPKGIANWSVTHVDWSEHKWHPKSYGLKDISSQLIKNLSSISESVHETSNKKRVTTITPCMWNGVHRPCYLFARKFLPETLDSMIDLFSTYTRCVDLIPNSDYILIHVAHIDSQGKTLMMVKTNNISLLMEVRTILEESLAFQCTSNSCHLTRLYSPYSFNYLSVCPMAVFVLLGLKTLRLIYYRNNVYCSLQDVPDLVAPRTFIKN
ncbi:glycosyl transferase, family 14 [Artemisia annua]|uniref:Glycosyl transferase, family 14 n=1 Tax=Artemisia annua TaxID=35608 RepID=A0A2U1MJN4_ARTAN|nr:glycosyl transferase, family 14 [Artemisia annua]